MILLNGHSLEAGRVIGDEALRLSLQERESTADWTPASMSGIGIKSWVRGNGGPGDGIVWRVQSIRQDYDSDTPTVQLEHIISTLRDDILFGEITPEMMGGSDGYCTALQAVQYILARSADWTLGSFGYASVTAAYKFDGDSLYDALEKVTNSLDDAWWSYDLTVYPFQLNITEKPDGIACELRAGRNLTSLTHTVDRVGMYTRFYPIGKDDLHIDGDYVSRNENIYGTISKVEVDQSLETKEELVAWANERLSKHAEPNVTVTADGMELAEATGESLDRLKLGRICRIPLHEYSTVIEERIVGLEYPDAAHEPEVVRITMANQQEDIAKIIAYEIKNGAGPSGGGGRGAARQAQEDHAWFEDTDEHVAMVAEGIVGIDPETGEPDWARLSAIIVSGEGIDERVTVMHDDIVEAQSSITINENAITSEVMRASSAEGLLRSEIVQTASMIRSEVHNTLSEFYTAIIQTASSIVIRTGTDTKTFHQNTPPVGTVEDPLVDGDVWFDSEGQFIWADAEDKSWLDDSSFNWGTLKETDIHRYDGVNNEWVKVLDGQALMQDTKYEQNREYTQMVAARVNVTRDEVQSYRAEFKVEAEQIKSTVREQVSGAYSSITQTATEIRNEVRSASSGIYSSITQTASQIQLEVRNTVSGISSRITQNANKISIVVDDRNNLKTASIVAGINAQDGSYVKISAEKINLSGYVTASDLYSTNARIDNLMSGSSVASALYATTVSASVLRVANSQASWKLANIPGYGYINYLGA